MERRISISAGAVKKRIIFVDVDVVKLVINQTQHGGFPLTTDVMGVDRSGRTEDVLTAETANRPGNLSKTEELDEELDRIGMIGHGNSKRPTK